MMKFFRKHNKTLLAVFMVLLMVVFVGGSALQSLLSPKPNRKVAQSKYGPITTKDTNRVRGTTGILSTMGITWPFLGGGRPPLVEIDWLLLTREAEELDAVVDDAAVDSWFAGTIDVNVVANRMGVKTDHIREAIRELLSVQVAQQAMIGASIPSEAEVRVLARKVFDKINVDLVTLPASAFIDEEQTFSAAEMESQWSPLRDVVPGVGLNFGYYVPTKLQVQYFKIDPKLVAENIGIANLESKAKRLYDDERERNPAFARNAAARDAESEGPEPPPYLSWEEAKTVAIDLIKKERGEEAAANVAHWIVGYDADRWIESTRGESGYKAPPDDVKPPAYYEDIPEHLPATLSFPGAVTVATTAFFAEDEAAEVEGIGGASYSAPSVSWKMFAKLAFRSQPIVPEIPKDAGTIREEYLAPFQTCPYALKDGDGSLYVFRIVDSRPGHPSESLDEVRDRVARDLRLLAGLEKAKGLAEGLRSCSPDTALKEAFDSDESIADKQAEGVGVGFHEVKDLTRMAQYEVGSSAARRGKFVSVGVEMVPDDVVNSWFELENAWERTAVFELHDRATVLVVEWKSAEPARNDEFEGARQAILDQLRNVRQNEAVASWFNPENIRARNEFALDR